MWHRRVNPCTLIVVVLLAAVLPARAETHLKQGDVIAVNGDSITEQKLYSVYIEDYLLMCKPAQDVRVAQFGWSGEVAPGFLGRMTNDVLWIKPTVATTCYGMNDGGYSPMDDAKAKRYRDATRAIVKTFKEAGVRTIIVGSPGAVDTDFFRREIPGAPEMYNKTLSALRDIARQVAEEEGVLFANVFDAMHGTMGKAKAKLGNGYNVCGADGFHPGPNGQLIMAYAFLKAMGCDGNIGTITLDAGSGKADASEGHKLMSSDSKSVEVESSRYPFCFYGSALSPDATRSIIPFLAFNEELNRFVLVVKNLDAPRANVTWGNATKEFSADDLAKGINLAAEFTDNPFSGPFQQVEQAIRKQQDYETPLHKVVLHNLASYYKIAPEEKDALDRIAAKAQAKDKEMFEQSAATVKPVKHVIRVELVK
jgi:lysophospholipase L1-like esterase